MNKIKVFLNIVVVFLKVYALYAETHLYSPLENALLDRSLSAEAFSGHTQYISNQYIPLEFYTSLEIADVSKTRLQNSLHNFLEHLQQNLTTSTVLNAVNVNVCASNKNQLQSDKLKHLFKYFENVAENARDFSKKSEVFFEITKNASNLILLKLRQVPPIQPMKVKMLLTNFFEEMEFFHIMFSEVVDVVLEYTQNTLRALQDTFMRYADIQLNMLRNRNFQKDETCCTYYMDFLQRWSAEIFKCAAAHELNVAYDIFTMTEINANYIMRQLEFRVQRIFNCFFFGKLEIRCRFLSNAEKDFEKLFERLEELEMYFDIKTNRGRVYINRIRRRRQIAGGTDQSRCLPNGFPDLQMPASLKSCFSFNFLN